MYTRLIYQFALVIGALGLIFFAGIGFFAGVDSGDPVAFSILATIGTVGLLFFAVIALPGLVAGYGLLKHHSWARILALVLGFFKLFSFPIGTAIGIYTFWGTTHSQGASQLSLRAAGQEIPHPIPSAVRPKVVDVRKANSEPSYA